MSAGGSFSCLLIDDDAGFVSMLAKVLGEEGATVTTSGDLASARSEVKQRFFDLVILDNRLPDGTGFEFHTQLTRQAPASIVIMITGAPELAQAVQLTRNGLCDYLTKPLDVVDFVACLRRAKMRLAHPQATGDDVELTGDSPAMREVVNSLQKAARHPGATILLLGETGSGKDLAARMLHRLTYGAEAENRPYVPLNCSAVPAEMFESELFGSEKGAYTGAEKRRVGLIEAADSGTLFLDEITEMPMGQQAKLLRFLESREYRLLGGNTVRSFAGRIIAATNRSLESEVTKGRFREDLMYRLNVAPIRLPALRERLSDLDRLLETVLSQLSYKYQRRRPQIRPNDLDALRRHAFPGNVRELRNLLERSLLYTPDDSAWLHFDPAWLTPVSAAPAPAEHPSFTMPAERHLNSIDAQEYRLIREALTAEGGGIRRAAGRLGITHQALLRRLEKWPELRNVTQQPS
jgi:DNA-binding NtrC family response regulator